MTKKEVETQQRLDCEGKPLAVFFLQDCVILVYVQHFCLMISVREGVGGVIEGEIER